MRHEADLQAASWKIEALSRELDEEKTETPPAQEPLEQALQAAQKEIAELRGKLAANVANDSGP